MYTLTLDCDVMETKKTVCPSAKLHIPVAWQALVMAHGILYFYWLRLYYVGGSYVYKA